jgi:4-amino-4-deoxy-L-arabinose transferase-like glycosyltransferase
MNQRFSLLLLIAIVLSGIYVRLIHFRDHITFQSDQGRDALIAADILTKGDIALIGPVTSVGNMYLGPLYYYVMTPFLALTYPDPSGPAYGIALLSIITIIGMYWVGKRVFNPTIALVASFFYAFMGVSITYSRFSWNPNIAPPLGLALFYALYMAVIKQKHRWWVIVGLLFALLLQSHYVVLSALPALLGLFTYSYWRSSKKFPLLISAVIAIGVLLVSLTPLVVFDFRHNHIISSGFSQFLTSNEEHIRPVSKLTNTIRDFELRSWLILAQFLGSKEVWSNRLLVILSFIAMIIIGRSKTVPIKKPFLLVSSLLVSAIVATSFYTSTIFDHYVLYLVPVICYFYAGLSWYVWSRWKQPLSLIFLGFLSIFYAYINLAPLKFWKPQLPSLDLYAHVVQDTLIHLPEGHYNMILLSSNRDYYGMNYRYFFEVSERSPQAQDSYENLDYLVVIDELDLTNPLDTNVYEIMIAGEKVLYTQFLSESGVGVWIYKIWQAEKTTIEDAVKL